LITFGDLAEDRKFDKRKVAEANEVQPQKYGFWADQYALAKSELERVKVNYDVTVAERSLYYRRNPPTDIKVTEAVMEALVTVDAMVIKARDALVIAQEAVNTLYAAVSSIQDVRSSIDGQIKIQGQQFYGEQDRGDITRDKLNRNKE
jgi:hypothetical protein